MKSFVRFATTLIATTLLFGCGGSDSSNTLDELNKNRAKWENANKCMYTGRNFWVSFAVFWEMFESML